MGATGRMGVTGDGNEGDIREMSVWVARLGRRGIVGKGGVRGGSWEPGGHTGPRGSRTDGSPGGTAPAGGTALPNRLAALPGRCHSALASSKHLHKLAMPIGKSPKNDYKSQAPPVAGRKPK